ncbi:hypothetical protein C1646_697697 [Rhizophagus diaphanus]|nr:hypothetical protein C1646_697697 [Rhizophagus diaphanus] [Rhizophagus sp. MUCL 43196]
MNKRPTFSHFLKGLVLRFFYFISITPTYIINQCVVVDTVIGSSSFIIQQVLLEIYLPYQQPSSKRMGIPRFIYRK